MIGSAALTKLGIHSANDLLQHWPSRYDDFSAIAAIADCVDNVPVTVVGTISKVAQRRSWKRRRLTLFEIIIHDDSGQIKATWFNQPYLAQYCKVGEQIYLSGKITTTKYGRQFANPIYEKVKVDTTHTARIVPRYPLTHGVTQRQLRYWIKQTLQHGSINDWLPAEVVHQHQLLLLEQAITLIHFPEQWDDISQAKRRLGFDELVLAQLFSLANRASLQQDASPCIPFQQAAVKQFVQSLPWPLTHAQRRVGWDIIQDLTKPQPMNRLLEGDVGTGKTAVAALAMYSTALAGYQAVLMAPTEILAEQHYRTICTMLARTNVTVSLLTAHHRSTSPSNIIIGTHALLNKKLKFKKLGLAIIDEQHRFGVRQRQQLKEQSGQPGVTPHLLSMTATPIPRSLALTVYGELTLSILDEFPAGRKPITSQLVAAADRPQLYQTIRDRIEAGEQVYVVAPKIEATAEDQPRSELASVAEEYDRLRKIFPTARLAQLHGKLSATDKQTIMGKFAAGEIDILVTTTVIEVGVDVPNATSMVIETADRFGLAQLHQLRGRVGRGDKASYCFVCTDTPSIAATQRLQYFVNHRDGFALADYDLHERGPGDVYGQEQSGFLNLLKHANLNDHTLLAAAQQTAEQLHHNLTAYPGVQEKIDQFYKKIHLE